MPEPISSRIQYAEVCLPLALPRLLTYGVISDWPLEPGMRVVVPLKGSRLYTGIVWRLLPSVTAPDEIRMVLEVIDSHPYLDPVRMSFLEWMSSYYLCSLGEVLLAAIPSAHRPGSESYLQRNPEYDWKAEEELDSTDRVLFEWLDKKGRLALAEVASRLNKNRGWMKRIRTLQDLGRIWIFDAIAEAPKRRQETWLSVGKAYQSDEGLDALFEELADSAQEEALMMRVVSKTRYRPSGPLVWSLAKADLELAEEEQKILKRLLKRGFLEVEKVPNSPFRLPDSEIAPPPLLSPAQTGAYQQILAGWIERKPVLFMGVTGSGKTEIYITAISETVGKGKQALLMLPEIAITLQIVHRLQRVFGTTLRVYHSRTSTNDRLDVWEGVAEGRVSVVVGVRSSVFLPFRDLGLVVVDEEHDPSYKQADPAPRYHGRDAAVYRAHLSGASVLLGSATPSVESYYKARSGKWHWVELTSRYGNAQLPEMELVDMRKATRTLKVKLELSETVLEAFQDTHKQGRQSILFQNRRGYAPFLECKDCGWAAYCPSCDVSLTVHQGRKSLSCHYCGYVLPLPSVCVTCGSSKLETRGYGTEKLEESLEQLLPDFRISRMDQDTTQSRVGFDRLLKRMASGDIDILVGTQMVTKGLDFESVTTVAVFDIDRILHYPDFRANERTYQLLSQIAGRAGRRNVQGKVWVQTSVPFHPLFRMVVKGEGELFYQQEVEHRREFGYPPFSRLVRLSTRHTDGVLAQRALETLTKELRLRLSPELVLGPEAPPIGRIRNQFIFHTLLKIPETHSHVKVKEMLGVLVTWARTIPEFKPVSWMVDVDPV